VPFALVPEPLGLVVYLLVSVGLTLLALRRLGLGAWWILFPPMMEGLLAANPHALVFALLVLGGSSLAGDAGKAIAVGLKIYAVMPIIAERRWRAGALAIGLIGISLVLAPQLWVEYVSSFGQISVRLAQEAIGGVSAALFLDPTLVAPVVGESLAPLLSVAVYAVPVALVSVVAVRDVRAAGWISVPLLWPAAQYSNGSFVLPVARRWSTWIIAIPTIPTYLVGLLVLCYEVASGQPSVALGPPAIGITKLMPIRPSDSMPRR
jgi:hypothetical protein